MAAQTTTQRFDVDRASLPLSCNPADFAANRRRTVHLLGFTRRSRHDGEWPGGVGGRRCEGRLREGVGGSAASWGWGGSTRALPPVSEGADMMFPTGSRLRLHQAQPASRRAGAACCPAARLSPDVAKFLRRPLAPRQLPPRRRCQCSRDAAGAQVMSWGRRRGEAS